MSTGKSGQIVGYARVSAADQNLDRQLAALGDVDRIFSEKVSGKNTTGRAQLNEMIAYVREGDTVRVKSADRLARSTIDLLEIAQQLRSKGVALEFVDTPNLNTDTAHGEFTLTILAAVAQLERSMIRERQAEGILLAKERGKYDRTPRISDEQIEDARTRIAAGVPKAVIARELGVARSTLTLALSGKGRYARPSTASEPA